MTMRLVTTDAATWLFGPEDSRPLADQIQSLLQAHVLDEITGAPPDVDIRVSTANEGLAPRVSRGGRVGLVSRPLGRYAPGFVAGAALSMTLAADGFLPRTVGAALPAQPGYPAVFAPADLHDVEIHRTPTTIAGRTVSRLRVVRAGANVRVSGVWATQADIVSSPTMPAPANMIAIACGLYAERPPGSSVRQCNIAPAPPAQWKQLVGAANVAAPQIRVSDQIGIAVGDLLLIDPPDPGRAEIVAITAITDPGSGPDLPATIVLAQALQRGHADGTIVAKAVPSAPGAPNPLARRGLPGDVTLFPATMVGLNATMSAVEVSGGTAPPEYHGAAIYAASSDPNGYVRLPPIHRLAQVELRIDHALEAIPRFLSVTLDWGRDEIFLDLVFK